MVKPEWGLKRTCNSCGAKFYDLRRDPIICPKCDATVDPAAIARSQRTRATAAAVAKEAPTPKKAKAEDLEDDLELADDDDVLDIGDEDDDDDDAAAIEDVSELGEDDDDMLGVIDKVGDEGEETR